MKPLRDTDRARALVQSGAITREASCLRKVSFAMRNHALAAAKGISNKTGRKTEVYGCSFCHGFHVTKLKHGEESAHPSRYVDVDAGLRREEARCSAK